MERPRIIVIGTYGALLTSAIHALAQDADLILVATDSPTPELKPELPTMQYAADLAMIETLKDIEGIRLDLQGPEVPDERMNPARPIGRIVDNAEATGANGHAARAVDYGLVTVKRKIAP